VAALPQTHECEWRDEAERLRGEVTTLRGEHDELKASLAALQRAVFGRKSEKLPRIQDELGRDEPRSREATLKERSDKRAAKAELPERVVHHAVRAEDRHCPKCGSDELTPLGEGKKSVVYEYVPARLERQVHVQETLRCRCGEGVVTAVAPKAVEKGQYGPGFLAHVVTAKCADSVPLYRQAKALARAGVPVARTTLGDLFHATAAATAPLSQRLLELVRTAPLVRADETPQRVLAKGKAKRAYVWTFRTEKLIAFVHSATRAGATAQAVLGGTKGYLLVDGYTGYNRVVLPEGRVRVGCWAHVRRKFFDALATAPESQEMLDLILELYRVEHHAENANTLGTEEHLAARRTMSAAVLARIESWLADALPRHPPRSPLGAAIGYARGQWSALKRFLEDASLPLDNNASERALRAIALGRKNYLFVGSDAAGENLAGLQALIATCEANSINPEAYLADVLPRLGSHPNAQLDELLPHQWSPAAPNSS